jgi:excisionase family DNA binding protein
MPNQKRYLTPPEAAAELGVGAAKIAKWIKAGEVPACNLATERNGRARLAIAREDLEAFLRSRRVVPSGDAGVTRQLRRRTPPNVKTFF